MAKMRKIDHNKCWKRCGSKELSWTVLKSTTTLGNSLIISTKIECKQIYNPAVLLLGI